MVPFSAACAVFAVVTLALTDPAYRNGPSGELVSGSVYVCLPFEGFIAALVATRRPRNPIGWILAATCALLSITILGEAWASWAQEGEVGGYVWAVAISEYAVALGFPLVPVAVPLLFPTGRPPTPRWNGVVVAAPPC